MSQQRPPADPNRLLPTPWESLLDAIRAKDAGELAFAIARGADVNAPGPDRRCPLFQCSRAGWMDGVAALLAAGARIDEVYHPGTVTAAMIAADRGNSDVLSLLISAGASLDGSTEAGTVAMIAAARGRINCVALVAQAGADLTIRDAQGRDAADWARWAGHRDCADAVDALVEARALSEQTPKATRAGPAARL